METAAGNLRIGELARRVGVTPEVLRAWERRYGLLEPSRSSGGFRLYSEGDARRVLRMREELGRGLSAAEAAKVVIAEGSWHQPRADAGMPIERLTEELRAALTSFDGTGAQAALDELLGSFTFETVAGRVLLPLLREIGERWAEGTVSITQEHFASNLLRGRLLALARGWDRGAGPRAILACPPGERHDLALLVFGLLLHGFGWRITYLGADTPIDTLEREAPSADVVVLSSVERRRFARAEASIARLAQRGPVVLAGSGATARLAERTGARLADGDPQKLAAELAHGL
jgi:MerR family transcriptional regulator, light-induced transcriptional regulator